MPNIESSRNWKAALRSGIASGSAASVVSSVVLSILGEAETDNPARPTNATSQWFWGERAHRARKLDLRHTLAGYLIHHATSVFWATLYEMVQQRRRRHRPEQAAADAALIASAAYFADYYLTPKRFTPGFERHLSKKALYTVYASFAVGLALTTFLSAGRAEARTG